MNGLCIFLLLVLAFCLTCVSLAQCLPVLWLTTCALWAVTGVLLGVAADK